MFSKGRLAEEEILTRFQRRSLQKKEGYGLSVFHDSGLFGTRDILFFFHRIVQFQKRGLHKKIQGQHLRMLYNEV